MIIEVIPFDISIDDKWFSYFIKDETGNQINIWSIVEVPFKNMVTLAIVSKMNSEIDEEVELKSIVSVICSMPILSKYQIDTIYELSSRYLIHIHKVLALFLPKFIYTFLEKKSFVDLLNIPQKTFKEKWEKRLLFCSKNDNFSEILNLLKENKNTALIFPDDFMLDDFIELYPYLIEKSIIYKNKFSYIKKYRAFIDTYNKTKNIIIWTRKILQYNLEAYEKIIYIEDVFVKYLHSYNHKYKNLDLIESFWKNWNFKIDILSKVPSLDLIYKASKKEYKLVNI